MSSTNLPVPTGYSDWLRELKSRIQGARQRALLAANAEQIALYHHLGCEILGRRDRDGWGAKVVERLASDLRDAFPDMRGFSVSNLKYMRFFAQECPSRRFGQQSADQLPWFHIVTLITKITDPELRAWYAQAAIEQAWTRETLTGQIESRLHLRQGAAVTNFERRLPGPSSASNDGVGAGASREDRFGLDVFAPEGGTDAHPQKSSPNHLGAGGMLLSGSSGDTECGNHHGGPRR